MQKALESIGIKIGKRKLSRIYKFMEELCERLVSKGKAKKLALVAVAHKLLRQAYGVLKSRRPFDENFCT
jgi:transposase